MSSSQYPFVGQDLGNYRVERYLDEGGMADLYLGRHIRLGTHAAIKILKEKLAQHDKHRREFQQEAVRIAHLDHPHIVRILDSGFTHDKPYLIMPLARGSLKNTQSKILQIETILTYVKQIAEALQYAHNLEIVHRDIKPGNFLIGSREEILLSDFGIATITHSVLVNAQEFAGTPHYMPPEQWRNQAVRASDQYALGICIYQWLCGDVPFRGSMEQLMWAHMQQKPPTFKEKGVDVALEVEKVIIKALSKDPKQRFESIQDFAQALEQASLSKKSSIGTLTSIHHRHIGKVIAVAWSPDARRIASLSDVSSFATSSESYYVVSDYNPSSVMDKYFDIRSQLNIWDPATGKLDNSLLREQGTSGLQWSSDGKYLALDGRGIEVWDVSTKRHVVTYSYNWGIYSFIWAPSAKQLAFTGRHTGVEVYNLDTTHAHVYAKMSESIDADAYSIWALAWSPDGSRIAVVETYICDYDESQNYNRASVLNVLTGHSIIRRREDGDIKVLTPTHLYFHSSKYAVNDVTWSPDSSRIAWISTSTGVVEVCNATSNTLLFTHPISSGSKQKIAFSPDWSFIASTEENFVHIWNATTSAKLFTYQEHTSNVLDIAWSPNNTHLASVDESAIHIWQIV